MEVLLVTGASARYRRLGRYVLCDELASGGMSTVHLARLIGPVGFTRTVAIKRVHDRLSEEPEFASMLIDEGRLAARIVHPNVVQTLDVATEDGELFLVMDYIPGESLSGLLRATRARDEGVPSGIVSAIVGHVLLGLHAAHEAVDDQGAPLEIVHRDVSPQNILVGADGIARVLDFGIAKAASRLQTTRVGQLKGKLAYMAPEQLLRKPVDRRTDLFAAGIVLWEALAGRKLFSGDDYAATIAHVLSQEIEHPSDLAGEASRALGDVALRALQRNPDDRYPTARDMAIAVEAAVAPATALRVAEWVEHMVGPKLAERALRVREIESSASLELLSPAQPREAAAEATATDLSAASRVPPSTTNRLRVPVRWIALSIALGAAVASAILWRALSAPAVDEPAVSARTLGSASPPAPVAAKPMFSALPESSASAASRPARAPSPARPRPAPRATGKPSCNPPYTVDAKGQKHFKPDCFE